MAIWCNVSTLNCVRRRCLPCLADRKPDASELSCPFAGRSPSGAVSESVVLAANASGLAPSILRPDDFVSYQETWDPILPFLTNPPHRPRTGLRVIRRIPLNNLIQTRADIQISTILCTRPPHTPTASLVHDLHLIHRGHPFAEMLAKRSVVHAASIAESRASVLGSGSSISARVSGCSAGPRSDAFQIELMTGAVRLSFGLGCPS